MLIMIYDICLESPHLGLVFNQTKRRPKKKTLYQKNDTTFWCLFLYKVFGLRRLFVKLNTRPYLGKPI